MHASSADNVTYDGITYTATYTFVLGGAWIPPQSITYRSWICLYNNNDGVVSQRSSSSIGVVRRAAEGRAWEALVVPL